MTPQTEEDRALATVRPTEQPEGALRVSHKALVTTATLPEGPRAVDFFRAKLAWETDPADVHHDLEHGFEHLIVIDARAARHYTECHIPGAVHLPYQRIRESTTRHLERDKILVTYCWGPGCNSSTKAAERLAALGFQVKEMIGGIEYWRREGYGVEGTLGDSAPLAG